jgi:hypothetical protein
VSTKISKSTTPTTGSLLSKFKASKPLGGSGPKTWHEKLRQSNPKLMEDIDALIDAFNAGEADVLRVASKKNPLANWLKAQCGLEEKPASIVRYISERASGAA